MVPSFPASRRIISPLGRPRRGEGRRERHGQVPGADHPRGGAGGGQSLCPGTAAGVCSQPSSGRCARALRASVGSSLQHLWPQPAGSPADPQRLQAQPRGHSEELRAFIQGERQIRGGFFLPAVEGGESQGASGRRAADPVAATARTRRRAQARHVAVPTPTGLPVSRLASQ